jgi:cytochrome P450
MCTMLVFAAHTTTTHLIGNGMLALLRQPEALAMLRADLSEPAMERAVEEFLRYDGPVQVARRVVLEPIQIDGRRIDAEEIIFPMLNAANRDPRQFPDPDRLDLARTQNRHIAFGFGPHFCAGAPLARMEAQIAFTAILRKLDDIQLAGPVEWIESFGFRGLKALPLEFRVSQ